MSSEDWIAEWVTKISRSRKPMSSRYCNIIHISLIYSFSRITFVIIFTPFFIEHDGGYFDDEVDRQCQTDSMFCVWVICSVRLLPRYVIPGERMQSTLPTNDNNLEKIECTGNPSIPVFFYLEWPLHNSNSWGPEKCLSLTEFRVRRCFWMGKRRESGRVVRVMR